MKAVAMLHPRFVLDAALSVEFFFAALMSCYFGV